MEIIAFEGLDKSGKRTQALKLKQALEDKGFKVVMDDFPRDGTVFGDLLRGWLLGSQTFSEDSFHTLHYLDKLEYEDVLKGYRKDGVDIVILDRHYSSMLLYAKRANAPHHLIKLMEQYITKPDFEIMVDITPEQSINRKAKFEVNDKYESNVSLLHSMRRIYTESIQDSDNGIVIDGLERDVDDIHQEIWQEVIDFFTVRGSKKWKESFPKQLV